MQTAPQSIAATSVQDKKAVSAPPDETQAEAPAPAAPPRITRFVAPVYPPALGDRAVQGRVDLQFKVAADGSVQDVAVVASGDHPQLAQAAVAALKQWRFAPDSVQTGHLYRQAIDFDLAGGDASCRILTGSHICRRDLDAAAAGVTVTTR